MSVMAQLKKFASDPSQDKISRDFLPDMESASGQGELSQMFEDHPIPGQSLTQDPDQRMPYETPPEFTDQREFIDHLFNYITESPRLSGILDTMRKGVPVENVAHKILQAQFRQGKMNPDLMILSIEPTIYILIAMATYADIDPVLYPEEDFDDEASTSEMSSRFRKAAKAMMEPDDDPKVTVDDLQAPAVLPSNLMARTSEAVSQTKEEMNGNA